MNLIFGKLTLESLPHEWFTIGGTAFMTIFGLATIILLIKYKKLKWLWNNWLTSVDPKKVGVMYIIVATAMLFRGGLDAIMIWLQQATAVGSQTGYLDAGHFQQIFTAHGNIMVFFVTMGFLFGLMNIILPLQIGTRDLAFPFLNTLGFWLYVAGAIMVNMFFVFGGDFSAAGWLSVTPLSELQYSPGTGVDYWIWSLQISGLGTMIGGINFLVTIIKNRAPGMTLFRMPIFTWASLCSMALVVTIFPILTVTTGLLFLDRFFGFNFFTTTNGGNAMMYINMIWMWGHPEVYVLILPAFGIYSEIVSTFSRKKLAGYYSCIAGLFGVSSIALLVWLHHFFTMGAGADVNAFFGISTMIISIPTAVLFFNWIATMYRGKIQFKTPMLWFLGFVATFTFGGMAGMLLSSPPADFQFHNSLFLVAHFHTMIIGGALFAIFGGITYWFPKVTGFKLDEELGRYAFWFWLVGFFMSFIPLYILGFMGATRRLNHYPTETGWQPLFIMAAIGGILIGVGLIIQVAQVVVSIRARKKLKDNTGDPWNARTLEWATSSPPPFYNFAIIPHVKSRDAFWEAKQEGRVSNKKSKEFFRYQNIEMPKNTAMGIYVSAFLFLAGFGFVWHIYWLIIAGLGGAIICFIIRSFNTDSEYEITAAELKKMEEKRWKE